MGDSGGTPYCIKITGTYDTKFHMYLLFLFTAIFIHCYFYSLLFLFMVFYSRFFFHRFYSMILKFLSHYFLFCRRFCSASESAVSYIRYIIIHCNSIFHKNPLHKTGICLQLYCFIFIGIIGQLGKNMAFIV